MSEAVKELMKAIRQLSLEEQLELWDSIAEELPVPPRATREDDPGFDAMLTRRLQEHLSGKDPGQLLGDALAEIRAELRKTA